LDDNGDLFPDLVTTCTDLTDLGCRDDLHTLVSGFPFTDQYAYGTLACDAGFTNR